MSILSNKVVITANNENLVKEMYRSTVPKTFTSISDVTGTYDLDLKNGDEFYLNATVQQNDTSKHSVFVLIRYTDGSSVWSSICRMNDLPRTYRPTIPVGKSIQNIAFHILGVSTSQPLTISNFVIQQKKSAELIVDGTITSKHLASNSIGTAHLQASSVTANILKSDAVEARHLKADKATFDKFFANEAWLRTLYAKTAFVQSVQAVNLDATRITSGLLRAQNGWMSINLNNGFTQYSGDGKIEFRSSNNVLYHSAGGSNAFLKFGESYDGKGTAWFGVNRYNRFNQDASEFTGIGVFNLYDSTKRQNVNQINLTADVIRFKNHYEETGYIMHVSPRAIFYPYVTAGSNLGDDQKPWEYLFVKNIRSDFMFSGRETGYGTPVMTNRDTNKPVSGQLYPISFMASEPYAGCIYMDDGTNVGNHTIRINVDSTSSDARLKENIQTCTHQALDIVNQFSFKSFDWKKGEKLAVRPHTKIGLIAQDVRKIDDTLVIKSPVNEEMLSLDDFKLLNVALKAIQELAKKVNRLEKKLEEHT